MGSKNLFFGTVALTALLVSACASPVNTPIPDDPQAQEWTPGIQTAYPDWQAPDGIPPENPDYVDSLLAISQADREMGAASSGQTPAEETEKNTDGKIIPVGEQKDGGETADETAAVQDQNKQNQFQGPDFIRVDILRPQGQPVESYSLNGEAVTLEQLKEELKKFAERCGTRKSTALIYVAHSTNVNAQQVIDMMKLCVDAGISSCSVVEDRNLSGNFTRDWADAGKGMDPEQKPGKTQRFKMAVDPEQTAAEYVVQPGDSLSVIAKKVYKDGNLWGILYTENKNIIQNKDFLKPGTKIKVPALRKVVIE